MRLPYKNRWISWLSLLLFIAPLQSLQSQNKPPSLENLQFTNRVHIEALLGPLQKLGKHYQEALAKLQKEFQKAGDLDGVLALRSELARHSANQTPAVKFSELKPLAKLQKIYLLSYTKQEAQLEKQLEQAKLDYKQKLQSMMRRLMAEGRQDEADQILAAFAEIDQPSGGGPVPFREQLDSDQYQAHLTRARLNLEELKKSRRSPYGYVVKSVTPSNTAENLGIQVGDRIIRIDGQELWCKNLDWHREKTLRKLVWEDGEGLQKNAEIGPGKIGISTEGDLLFPQYFLMFGKRSPRWDDFILTALLTAESDPALAETALHQAVMAGYQADELSSAIGALIALRENRLDNALAFARHILKRADNDSSKIPHAIFPVFYRIALATGQVDLLEQADREAGSDFSRLSEELWPDFMRHWNTVRPDWKPAGRPSIGIDTKLGEDVFKNRKLDTNFISSKAADIPRRQSGSNIFSVGPNHFILSFHTIDGGLRNFVWETVFTAKPNDSTPEEHRFQPMIEFTALHHLKGAKQPLASIRFFKTTGSQYRLAPRGGQLAELQPYFYSKWDAGEKSATTRLRIIRINNEVEIQVNGATQLWLPLNPQTSIEDVGFYIKIIGMIVDFKETHIWRLP